MGYSPLGAPGRPDLFRDKSHTVLIENDVIVSVAKKHGCTPAQVPNSNNIYQTSRGTHKGTFVEVLQLRPDGGNSVATNPYIQFPCVLNLVCNLVNTFFFL